MTHRSAETAEHFHEHAHHFRGGRIRIARAADVLRAVMERSLDFREGFFCGMPLGIAPPFIKVTGSCRKRGSTPERRRVFFHIIAERTRLRDRKGANVECPPSEHAGM